MKHLILSIYFSCLIFFQTTAQWTQTAGPSGGRINALAVHNENIYAGLLQTGIFCSHDDGQTWHEAMNGLTGFAIVTLAANENYVFTGLVGDVFGNGAKAYRSADSANSWVDISQDLHGRLPQCFTFKWQLVYAGTDWGIYVSYNQGINWFPITTGIYNAPVSKMLIVDSVMYAATDKGVMISTDTGATWFFSNNGLTDSTVRDLAVYDNKIFAATNDGLFISYNQGGTWQQRGATLTGHTTFKISVVGDKMMAVGYDFCTSTDTGVTWPTHFPFGARELIVDDSGHVYHGQWGRYGSVHKSIDSCNTWIDLTEGLIGTDVLNITTYGGYLFAGTSDDGYARSSDGGQTWFHTLTGWANNAITSFCSTDSSLIIVTGGEIFISKDSGSTITLATTNPGQQIWDIVKSGNRLFCPTTFDGIYVSVDGGYNWTQTSAPIGVTWRMFANAGRVFCMPEQMGIYASDDSGLTWGPRSNGLLDSTVSDLIVVDSVLIALTQMGPVYHSYDNGNNWINSGGFFLSNEKDLAVHDGKIFAATAIGVFMSPDKGLTWINIGQGLNIFYDATSSICIDSPYVYLGTFDRGVWKRDLNDFTTDVANLAHTKSVSVYPNPSTGTFRININSTENTLLRYEISDLFGKIYSGDFYSKEELNFENFSAGIYLYKILQNGIDVGIGKIVIVE